MNEIATISNNDIDNIYPTTIGYQMDDFNETIGWNQTNTCAVGVDTNRLEFWVCGIGINLIGCIGILGNVLSMIILSRPQMRSSINYLLIYLARCDTILIITSILLFGLNPIYYHTGYLRNYVFYVYPHIATYVFPIAMIVQTASVYITLTVTLERYVAVCHPLRARALCTYGRAKIYVLVCLIFATIYNFPKFFEVTVIHTIDNDIGKIYCVKPSNLRKNIPYQTYYILWGYLIVNYLLPFSCLAIFNTIIYRQVRKANRERQRLSRSERREIGLATMLLCVVTVFFLMNILAVYNNFAEAISGVTIESLVDISNLLVTINSSVNFIIYVIFGEKFKRIFLMLFCKGYFGRESGDGLMHDDSSFSNGDALIVRGSMRLSRHGTQRTSLRTDSSMKLSRSMRVRVPSPAPCVYYPARDVSPQTEIIRSNLDWDNKNGCTLITTNSTTGF